MDKKSLKDVKRNNTAKVLEYILKQGPVSRIEIAEQSRFSPSTVSMAVSLLLKDGIVEEVREGVSTGGRKPILLQMKIGRNTVLGQPLGHVAADFGDLAVVALPEIHVVERVVRTGKIGGIQDIMDPAVVVNRRFMKVQHKNLTVFLCSSNSILHLSIARGGIC